MRAGKTYAILQYLIALSQSRTDLIITVVTNTLPALRLGALRDFKHILKETGHHIYFSENKTTNTFTCDITGSVIEFVGLDEELKARGASRDVLFVNEANRISWDTFDQLALRTSETIWVDYNPTARFWVHDKLLDRNDTDFIILTYLDNEEIPPQIKTNIESRDRTSNWWKVYGLGEIGELEGNIFKGWEFADQLPPAELLMYGLDFGFKPDPCAAISLWKTDYGLGVQEELYQGELTSKNIIEWALTTIGTENLIIADNARPEIIAEMRQAGLQVLPCIKQENINGQKVGVLGQLEMMQQEAFICVGENLKREYEKYRYQETKDGTFKAKVPDGDDHLIDALRYAWYWHNRQSILEQHMAELLKEY